VYNILLDHVHAVTTKSPKSTVTAATPYIDGDDVYFRFGGAVISDMLHLRYRNIRKCSDTKREVISMEIKILHFINTKDKSSIPAYLKYRDQGYMYTPHHSFIEFIKNVDKTVQEIIKPAEFEEHGDQIAKLFL
jgi:hypothetical protein